jgi:hypothetical protein
MNEVKALILEAIERLNESNTQAAFKAQNELNKALDSLSTNSEKVSSLRCA